MRRVQVFSHLHIPILHPQLAQPLLSDHVRGRQDTLVKKATEAVVEDDADEVVLETEITNKPALEL